MYRNKEATPTGRSSLDVGRAPTGTGDVGAAPASTSAPAASAGLSRAEELRHSATAMRALLLLATLALLALETGAVKCYVCSWSRADSENDTCSSAHFNPRRVPPHECDSGCETVTMRDANGEIEMFYRNCYTKTDNSYMYSKEDTKVNEEEVYKCNSVLCNGVERIVGRLFIFLTFALLKIT